MGATAAVAGLDSNTRPRGAWRWLAKHPFLGTVVLAAAAIAIAFAFLAPGLLDNNRAKADCEHRSAVFDAQARSTHTHCQPDPSGSYYRMVTDTP